MDSLQSQADVYIGLCMELILCDPLSIVSSSNLQRDCATLLHRAENEGISFLTKVMPKLGKALDAGLSVLPFTVLLNGNVQ